MKKLLIAILAILATAGFSQEAFPDIPAGHWAGDAVTRIADLGIVIGFPDGTYRGNENVTRYQTALIISRLLDVIQTNMDAMKAMTDADIASLRNALQELASDVAAQGVRLNAAEGAIASISDDVMSNTARLDALENTVATHGHDDMMGGIDPAVLAGLQNQIDSARVAADTAAAQAAAAAAAAGAAADAAGAASAAAGAASAQARQNAASIDAINDLLGLLNSDIDGLKADVAAMSGMEAPMVDLSGVEGGVARNASDIANIREFVILLRRDQVALRDRVAALEAADAGQADAIADLTARVTKIEEDLFTISGSIEAVYQAFRVNGNAFDIDRAIGGSGQDRTIAGSNFSSGEEDDFVVDDDDIDAGEFAQDRADITNDEGETDVTVELTVGFGSDRAGAGSPRALNSFESVMTLSLNEMDVDGDSDPDYVFEIEDFATTFEPIGADPLTFAFGQEVASSFTDYILDVETDGFRANVGSPDFLAFLAPTLTVVYGELDADSDATFEATDTYFRGVRGTLTPLSGDAISATGGFSFVERTTSAGEVSDTNGDNDTYSVWGVDGQVGISVIDLGFEFANESTGNSLFYVTADVDLASFPIIDSLSANFRQMPETWDGVDFGGGDFDLDQTGFGVEAGLGLFGILDPLSFYFDSYEITSTTQSVQAFGIDAQINLFAAFAIEGFFHSASVDGTNVDNLDDAGVLKDSPTLPFDDNAFGVSLVHDGDSANALIGGVDISAGYEQSGADLTSTKIFVDADTDLSLGFLSFSPYVGFESINDTNAGTDDTTTIKAGTGIKTDTFNIIGQPSLEAAVNFRTTDHSDADTFTSTELQYAFGVTLGEFLFDYSTLTVKYGSWSGTNINNDVVTAGDPASDISEGDENNGLDQSVSGYEVVWDYYDLIFAYAAYDSNDGANTSAAQAFKITYVITF